jgi:uncharacterized protein CbrC (UPF0167 family)
LFKRTPGLVNWRGEHWLAHCGDYCAFIAYVGAKELNEMGIAEEVLADYAETDGCEADFVREYLEKGGDVAGYLFRCLHCGKYRCSSKLRRQSRTAVEWYGREVRKTNRKTRLTSSRFM